MMIRRLKTRLRGRGRFCSGCNGCNGVLIPIPTLPKFVFVLDSLFFSPSSSSDVVFVCSSPSPDVLLFIFVFT